MKRLVRMHEKDMVATALADVFPGDEAGIYDCENALLYTLPATEYIPYGNKIALEDIPVGTQVIKYGAVIGTCTRDIAKGALVHVHNVKSNAVDIPPAFKLEIMRQMNIAVGEEA